MKTNPNFRTVEGIEKQGTSSPLPSEFKLKRGETKTIRSPNLGNQKNLILTKLNYRVGDIVKYGDILCEIENENVVMEFESVFEGKIIWCSEENKELSVGMEIYQIEGI
ncbi:hypothetical protein M0D21_10130 [Aquimarina sp. D1M17]|uniref:biotin/lipoyl-containing protein n=1 Tax=Aquimarina acroporae TaxID=2937283 RepID=UPI0020BED4B6|nr:biotin/lipoyl-containing protein [Aquimarina acroporae]MCK8521926.1 hypothetical protein [Aquimarina acroporae]